MTSVRYRIAGIQFAIHGPLSAGELGVQDRLKPFLESGSEGEEEVAIHWEEGDPGKPVEGEVVFDPGMIWKVYRSASGERFWARFHYPNATDGHGRALLEATPGWDRIRITERWSEPPWQSLLSLGAGEVILRGRILFAPGIVCHAFAVEDEGRGFLFVGHSGAGKSTQAALWAARTNATVLSDDRVAVRMDGKGPSIHGTPWGGDADIATNHRAPLTAVFILGQAPQNSLRRLSPVESVPLLAVRSFLPF